MTQILTDPVAPAANSAAVATSSSISPAGNDETAHESSSPGDPAPPTVAPPTRRTGLQTTGPWIVGELYSVVPSGPLALVPDHGEKFYAITKGRYVGVTNNNAFADGAVSRVSHALRAQYDSQAEAVTVFNDALASGLNIVEVI
ncbi:hypothetical protein B0H11DRAFT_2259700 [Mycena galericulata]|nr:hypothetical protein B0H11DRAFT_2259700 [Mycena galericulata]